MNNPTAPRLASTFGKSDKSSSQHRSSSPKRHPAALHRPANSSYKTTIHSTLEDICRNVIVSHLERYHPAVFRFLYEDDWDNIIRLRHCKTKPKEGTGGLDGTGRVAPAISDKVLSQIELQNPHLRESAVVDELVWKDCVEFRFKRGGLTRPTALNLPWPLLVAQVQKLAEQLLECVTSTTAASSSDTSNLSQQLPQVVNSLSDLPMNVELLQATGIGKTVSKALKRLKKSQHSQGDDTVVSAHKKLEDLLQTWKNLASDTAAPATPSTSTLKQPRASGSPLQQSPSKKMEDEQSDLALACGCSNWRQLFEALKQREDLRRSSQGKRMREIRKQLASGRPKVVKVRPVVAKHDHILANKHHQQRSGTSGAARTFTNPKMAKVRLETSMLLSRQLKAPPPAAVASFGDALAFVSKSKKNSASRQVRTIKSSAGKLMSIPVGRVSAGAASGGRTGVGSLRKKLSSKRKR